MKLEDVWKESLSAIETEISKQSFDSWFKPLKLEAIEGDQAYLVIPNRFVGEWLKEHYYQLLERNLRVPQNGKRGFFVLFVTLDQPQDADAVIELPAPALLVLLPEDERARRHPRIDLSRPVRRANDTRLAARAGATVARAPGVEQRDTGALPSEEERRPTTERTGANHDYVRLLGSRHQASEGNSRAGFEK